MSNPASVMIILSDHDQRVQFRNMAEERFGLVVFSVADPLEGLTLLRRIPPPNFLLLSSQNLPIMNYVDFLKRKTGIPEIFRVPVVLLSPTPVVPMPEGVEEVVVMPLDGQVFARLVRQFCPDVR